MGRNCGRMWRQSGGPQMILAAPAFMTRNQSYFRLLALTGWGTYFAYHYLIKKPDASVEGDVKPIEQASQPVRQDTDSLNDRPIVDAGGWNMEWAPQQVDAEHHNIDGELNATDMHQSETQTTTDS